MTIADRARAHKLWPAYLAADSRAARSAISVMIAEDLELTESQRLKNLPKIAAQTKPKGRPRKVRPVREYDARCPVCQHVLVIEVP